MKYVSMSSATPEKSTVGKDWASQLIVMLRIFNI